MLKIHFNRNELKAFVNQLILANKSKETIALEGPFPLFLAQRLDFLPHW